MTSINTNIAAQTALRTLQSTNAQLDTTQGRISTGLKIGEAKDNAAYWSISTTLKSDSRSLSTVQDALSLGVATVDTAYQGTNQAREVLEELQNKIILASGNSADKVALQREISQLQQNLKAIAGSSGFSGENWLSVDSGAVGHSDTKSVVSSFNREKSGAVTLDTIEIDAKDFALINASDETSGIFDGGKSGNTSRGGLVNMTNPVVGGGGPVTTGTLTLTDLADDDVLKFKIAVDGAGTFSDVSVTLTDASDLNQIATDIQAQLTGVNVTAANGKLTFTSTETDGTEDVDVKDFSFARLAAHTPTPPTGLVNVDGTAAATGDKGTATTATLDISGLQVGDVLKFKMQVDGAGGYQDVSVTLTDVSSLTAIASAIDTEIGARNVGVAKHATLNQLVFTSDATAATTPATVISRVQLEDFTFERAAARTPATPVGFADLNGGSAIEHTFAAAFGDATTFDDDDTLTFQFAVNGAAAKTVTIDRKTVVDAGFTDGEIANASEFATVLNQALGNARITGVTASDDGGAIKLATTATGSAASIQVTGLTHSQGVNILTLDVSTADTATLDRFRNAVVSALSKLTDNAATLGAIGKRIELQETFVSKLVDTIDKGVSGLVDADMNEESTRLQALQVKQQLGVQALSIANQSAQNVLRLFQ